MISSGATFEALAMTLIFFEDAAAALFGRRGKDGGQDARSGDGTRVFQAKHHQDRSASKAIADAKSEAAKIAKYRTLGHSRHDQWKGVTHWRLVTNAVFNPTDREAWDKEVVPLFRADGLAADYWECANLEALLERHPEVDRAFFQNETRVVLSVPEIKERLPDDEPFLRHDTLGGFFGRNDDISAMRAFLNDEKQFLVVHGAGGIGKTRLLIEGGEEIAAGGEWQVLWANTASMTASGRWFDAIVPERKTLLLVDEPDSADLLRVLVEQLGGRIGRTSAWKVAVAVRSPKDPILKFLRGPRLKHRVSELALDVLSPSASEAMCRSLLNLGPLASRDSAWLTNAAQELATRVGYHPVWLTLAVHVLEQHGDLTKVPGTARDLAASYLEEILTSQADTPSAPLLALLRWLALIATANREDKGTLELLAERASVGSSSEVIAALTRLLERRVVRARGARARLIEIKPDVFRDFLLVDWLTINGAAGTSAITLSRDATTLIDEMATFVARGPLNSIGTSILISIGRTDTLLKLAAQPTGLLDRFFEQFSRLLSATTASQRLAVCEALLPIAAASPREICTVVAFLRTQSVSTETTKTALGVYNVGFDDIVLELGWLAFHAALGARDADEQNCVLAELCALTEAEEDIRSRRPQGLPRDGRRASELIGRVLQGGPDFLSEFGDSVALLAERLIEEAASQTPTAGRHELLRSLLIPATSIERQQVSNDDTTFHFVRMTILPNHPYWASRVALLRRIQSVLSDARAPSVSRCILWDVLASAHEGVNIHRSQVPEAFREEIHRSLREDLEWALTTLSSRTTDLNELRAARRLWEWHFRYDKDSSLKDASSRLEALYSANSLVSEFEGLVSDEDWTAKHQRNSDVAAQLAASDPGEIDALIARANEYLPEQSLYSLGLLFSLLGRHAVSSASVRDFIQGRLSEPTVAPIADLAAIAAAQWISHSRGGDNDSQAAGVLNSLLSACGTDAQRINLLRRTYASAIGSPDSLQITSTETELLLSCAQLFLSNGAGAEYIRCLGGALGRDPNRTQGVVESTLSSIPDDQLPSAIAGLVEIVYWAVELLGEDRRPMEIGKWLIDQILRLPNVDGLDSNSEWRIDEVLRRVHRHPISWLSAAITRRREIAATKPETGYRVLGYQTRLGKYVEPVRADQGADLQLENDLCALAKLATEPGIVAFNMPSILNDIDPSGILAPKAIDQLISAETDRERTLGLARLAGAYPIGSDAWRTIARPILIRAASQAAGGAQAPLLRALISRGPQSWSSAIGEVPQHFIAAVESARVLLEGETEPEFRTLWKLQLEAAEAQLRDAEDQAREERGE